MPKRAVIPNSRTRAAARRRAERAADLTAAIDSHLTEKERASRQRDRLWAEASAMGMAHTEMAEVAGLHHSQVDTGVRRHRERQNGRRPASV